MNTNDVEIFLQVALRYSALHLTNWRILTPILSPCFATNGDGEMSRI